MATRRPVEPAAKMQARHAPFYYAIVAGIVVAGAVLMIFPRYAIPVGANAMFAVYLVIVALEFPRLTADYLHRRPDEVDSPVVAIFIVTGLVVLVAMGSLFLTLNDGGGEDLAEIGVSVVSVLLGWFTVHTMAALHYAHEYYRDAEAETNDVVLEGLDFPGGERPGGFDFLYFSYVLGMTAQVADVPVTSSAMRRRVTIHGVFSFFFNTIIVAATVNVVVAIAGS